MGFVHAPAGEWRPSDTQLQLSMESGMCQQQLHGSIVYFVYSFTPLRVKDEMRPIYGHIYPIVNMCCVILYITSELCCNVGLLDEQYSTVVYSASSVQCHCVGTGVHAL